MEKNRALVIFSGGMDSTTLLIKALSEYKEVQAIVFNYGQKHLLELSFAYGILADLKIPYYAVNISNVFIGMPSSSLLGNSIEDVRDTSKKAEKDTYIPNRNQLFITVAHAYAQTIDADDILIGVSALACMSDITKTDCDELGRPDCREAFIKSIEATSNLGSGKKINILAPFIDYTKYNIWQEAERLNCVDFIIHNTYSCYTGMSVPKLDYGYSCSEKNTLDGTYKECLTCRDRRKGYEQWKRSKK